MRNLLKTSTDELRVLAIEKVLKLDNSQLISIISDKMYSDIIVEKDRYVKYIVARVDEICDSYDRINYPNGLDSKLSIASRSIKPIKDNKYKVFLEPNEIRKLLLAIERYDINNQEGDK